MSAPEIAVLQESCAPSHLATSEDNEHLCKPKVLIAGSGLGSMTLAILLHKANIPFLIFERAREIKLWVRNIILYANRRRRFLCMTDPLSLSHYHR